MNCKLCGEWDAVSIITNTYDGEDIPVCAQCEHAFERGQASPDAYSITVEEYDDTDPVDAQPWELGMDPTRCSDCGALLEEDEKGHVFCPVCDGRSTCSGGCCSRPAAVKRS